ncbi:hypothetical protein HHI36_021331 [Cryptolaemus montrouzieri]|uniref:Major facilitator superfamily (MFS) profile domain-containing protein n=1 Tax=Cryptolaemus montrouzieri TaxID=559131 RepID=A0ABD2MWM1_9CUCU
MKEENGEQVEDKKEDIMRSLKGIGKTPVTRQFLVAFGPIVITGVLGMTEGYSSILLPQLQNENSTIQVDTKIASLIASMASFPMVGGCIAGGYAMEKIGRKAIHIWACLPLVLGWFIIAAAPNSLLIIMGRFLTGVSDGLLGPPTGVYIAETAQPSIRGALIMATCVAIAVGVFSVHLMGIFFTWRTTALISGLIPIPIAVLMYFMPESPTFLAKIERIEEAKKAFYWCRGTSKESNRELQELIERQEELNNTPKMSLRQQARGLSKPEFWKPTVIISVLFFTSQITGNNAIASYSITILQECGVSGEFFDEYMAMVVMDSSRLISSVISCILVNTLRRRSLALLSGYGVTVMLFLLCSYLFISPLLSFNSPFLVLMILVGYVCSIAFGLLPLSWTMMGEVFPLAYRGLGTGISSSVCYLFLYLVVQTFPLLLLFFGDIFCVFLVYCVCTLGGTVFLTFFLPETKDKPLFVIEDNFKNEK